MWFCHPLKPKPCSVLYKAHKQQKTWVVCQAAGDSRPFSVREPGDYRVHCSAIGLNENDDRQRAYICWRDQDQTKIEEYSNEGDSFSPVVTRTSSEVLSKKTFLFISRDPFLSKQIGLNGIMVLLQLFF